jgi:hypothetical protein
MRNRIRTEHSAPIGGKPDWQGVRAQVGFRELLLKNDEGAPITLSKVL